mmetsp:Transcript_9886/g.20437  ORF Transcript_9886/g.20437 Transcript_9886/m.20437 type:complete len:203 (-) Transcript_9886:135-743(-)
MWYRILLSQTSRAWYFPFCKNTWPPCCYRAALHNLQETHAEGESGPESRNKLTSLVLSSCGNRSPQNGASPKQTTASLLLVAHESIGPHTFARGTRTFHTLPPTSSFLLVKIAGFLPTLEPATTIPTTQRTFLPDSCHTVSKAAVFLDKSVQKVTKIFCSGEYMDTTMLDNPPLLLPIDCVRADRRQAIINCSGALFPSSSR